MADMTIAELARFLAIPVTEILTEVRKTRTMSTVDSVLTDEQQKHFIKQFQLSEEMKMENETNLLNDTKAKLELLFQYEKHYLELIKTYKEEIKFASSLQEDLRRERSQFFTQTLREVVQTLQTQEIDKKVASQWIEELVASYTKSIDLSSDLAKTHVVQVLNIFKEEAKREVSKAKLDDFKPSVNAE